MILGKISILAAVFSFFGAVSPALADYSDVCKEKERQIERRMEYARAHNNMHQLQGLEIALSKIKAYCDGEDEIEKSQLNVQEKQLEVRERELELQEAIADGKQDKILKRERKLADAVAELQEAQDELDALLKLTP